MKDLERLCRKLVAKRKLGQLEHGPLGGVWSQVALTLDHMDDERRDREELSRHVNVLHGQIENKLANLEHNVGEPHHVWMEKERQRLDLTHSRIRLETQRRRISESYSRTMRDLQSRLLELWNQSFHLNISDECKGHNQDT